MHVREETKSEYLQLLQRYRIEQSLGVIPNRFPWHSQLAVRELLRAAFSMIDAASEHGDDQPVVIRILTGTCPIKVYGPEAFEAIESFVNAGGHVKVLVWNESLKESENPLFALARVSSNVHCRISGTNVGSNRIQHFLSVGDRAYRLEKPHGDLSGVTFTDFSPELLATICFNDPKGAQSLIGMFDYLWDRCRPIVAHR